MDEPWCVLGDFNAILTKDDRIGGDEIHDYEIKQFADFLEKASLNELRWTGSYFSWTNKTIHSRIDRVFVNDFWYGEFDYNQTFYLPQGLSDHTPMMVDFSLAPRPKKRFQFCDMWIKNPEFQNIIDKAVMPKHGSPMQELARSHQLLRKRLSKLNKNNYRDLTE